MKENRFILFAVFFVFSSFQQNEFSGKVVAVLDGDTIEVLHDGKAQRIRLSGIDCPEKSQAFGTAAKKFTSDMVYGKEVQVIGKGLDRYNRIIGNVYVGYDKEWLNMALIKAGLAWHYKAYSNDKNLAVSETKARIEKAGLWIDSLSIPPWNFRRMH